MSECFRREWREKSKVHFWVRVRGYHDVSWTLGPVLCDAFPTQLHEATITNCCSVIQSCPTLCNPMDCSMPGFLVLHHLWVSSNLCPLNQWCHPAISPSVIPFFSWLQSFPASGSFLMSWLFASGGQSTGASASASVLPMNIQGWFPLALTDLISFQSKGLSRVFFSTLVQKYQFFSAQPFLLSSSHIHTWLLEKP